ncbi:hypothetical protein [Leptolyngbya sp. BC1307]|uniref:hypothetical protein n=1 Tax=Leptolyngbya sp. BC1307 TaxID=2029589 RepID=UPI000EFB25AE|nr:hypothetical protein [Leptolyngbya sp. BC1307]
MDLSSALQQEVEQIARRQGLSPEQFILQAVTEKINALKAQVSLSVTLSADTAMRVDSVESRLRDQDGILVFDTESLEQVDFDALLEQSRGRSWEELGL